MKAAALSKTKLTLSEVVFSAFSFIYALRKYAGQILPSVTTLLVKAFQFSSIPPLVPLKS